MPQAAAKARNGPADRVHPAVRLLITTMRASTERSGIGHQPFSARRPVTAGSANTTQSVLGVVNVVSRDATDGRDVAVGDAPSPLASELFGIRPLPAMTAANRLVEFGIPAAVFRQRSLQTPVAT